LLFSLAPKHPTLTKPPPRSRIHFCNNNRFHEDWTAVPWARSYVRVDDKLIVNNGGLHGNRQECGPVELAAGLHRIQCSVFQAGGAVDILLRYSGPDTNGQLLRPRSESSSSGLPPLPAASAWTMRLFSSAQTFYSLPDWTLLDLKGSRGDVPYINFHSVQEFRNVRSHGPYVTLVSPDITLCMTAGLGCARPEFHVGILRQSQY